MRSEGLEATQGDVLETLQHLRSHPNVLARPKPERVAPKPKPKTRARTKAKRPKPEAIADTSDPIIAPPTLPVPVPPRVREPKPVLHRFRALLRAPRPLRDATLLGGMVLRIPALLPGIAAAVFVAGMLGYAGSFVFAQEDLAVVDYVGQTLLGLVAAAFNALLLAVNAVVAGVSLLLKILASAVVASVGLVFDHLFRPLFDAVDYLIRAVPGIDGEVRRPSFDPGAIAAGPLFHFHYAAPGDAVDCPGLFAPVRVEGDELACAASWLGKGPFAVGDVFEIPDWSVTEGSLPEVVQAGLEKAVEVFGRGFGRMGGDA